MDGQYETAPVNPGTIPHPRGPVRSVPPVPPVPAQAVAPQVPAARRGPVDTDRGRVLARHARLMRSGRPEVCKPGRREQEALDPRSAVFGSDGKVIYPDRDAAECAARELEELGGRPQRPYLCARSRRGHFHLTTDHATERRRRTLHELIPRQR